MWEWKPTPMQYYVMSEKIAKFAKLAGKSLDDVVEDAMNCCILPLEREKVKQLVTYGGPTYDTCWILGAVEKALYVPTYKIARYKEMTDREEPLDKDIRHFAKNNLISNPFQFVFLRVLWDKVQVGRDGIHSKNAAGRRREALFNEFGVAAPARRVEMFHEVGMELELFLFVDASLFFGKDAEGAWNPMSVRAFRRVLQTARPSYGIVDVVFLWHPADAERMTSSERLKETVLAGMDVSSSNLTSGEGCMGEEILRYWKARETEQLIIDYHIIDRHLEDYSISDRVSMSFYYADAPDGFTEDDAEEFLYAYVRCK